MGLLLLLLGGLIVLTAVWIAATGLIARRELNVVKADLTRLKQDVSTGDLGDARTTAADLAKHAHRAHSLTTGPAWYFAAVVPSAGAPIKSARVASAAVDALGSRTVPKLIDISHAVNPRQFHIVDHRIDVTPLVNQTAEIDAATQGADLQRDRVAALPQHTWLAPIDRGVVTLNASLGKLVGTLDGVDKAAHAAPVMLGYTSPQRYFVGFQNEAEARGSGGLPGAFAILVADHGKLSFTHFGSDSELEGVNSHVDLGADFNNQWRDFTASTQYLNSTVSPNFPDAARIWAGMWQTKSGEHIDAALSLDPTAVSYFLGATGPAKLSDGTEIASSNIVPITESKVYAMFPTDNAARKAYLLDVAKVVDEHVLSGAGGSTVGLVDAAAKAAGERRLLLWSETPSVERDLSSSAVGGTIPQTAAPFAGLIVNNYAANKMDYYLDRSMSWQASHCGNTRDVTVTIRLTNNAPASGLSWYVTQRTDDPWHKAQPGATSVLVTYVGTTGGEFVSATVDGRLVGALSGRINGHPTYGAVIELPRAKPVVFTLQLREPASRSMPVVERQPLVRDFPVTFGDPSC